jgi:hypothetical protein
MALQWPCVVEVGRILILAKVKGLKQLLFAQAMFSGQCVGLGWALDKWSVCMRVGLQHASDQQNSVVASEGHAWWLNLTSQCGWRTTVDQCDQCIAQWFNSDREIEFLARSKLLRSSNR